MGAIRLFLAMIVATDHSRMFLLVPTIQDVPAPAQFELGVNAGFAVMFFYVLSGFLMAFVLHDKYAPSVTGTLKFYQSRFIRIFSLYWPMVLLAFVTIPGSLPTFLVGPWLDKFTNIFLFGMDWNRSQTAAVGGLQQAWTLGVELMFYVIAPFVLRSRIATYGLCAASAIIRAVAVQRAPGGFDSIWTYTFFGSTVVFFLLGAIAYDLAERFIWLKRRVIGSALLCLVPYFLCSPTYVSWDWPRFWFAFVCFAASLPGVFNWTKDSRASNAMGELSYPLYLVHSLVIFNFRSLGISTAIVGQFGKTTTAAWLTLISIWVVALAAAFIAHRMLEIPTAALMRLGIRAARNQCSALVVRLRPVPAETPVLAE
jgi:peptidoglycan/LPS O-acetylase OafA/YrhL